MPEPHPWRDSAIYSWCHLRSDTKSGRSSDFREHETGNDAVSKCAVNKQVHGRPLLTAKEIKLHDAGAGAHRRAKAGTSRHLQARHARREHQRKAQLEHLTNLLRLLM